MRRDKRHTLTRHRPHARVSWSLPLEVDLRIEQTRAWHRIRQRQTARRPPCIMHPASLTYGFDSRIHKTIDSIVFSARHVA